MDHPPQAAARRPGRGPAGPGNPRRRSFQPGSERLEHRTLLAASALVYPGVDGRLLYTPDDGGDRIPDFSNVGYKGGTVALPVVPVRATVGPGPGDDGAAIQAAIDGVSALPLDANGFRGAVLLAAGEYQVNGSVAIRASGVVLRGAGDGPGGTVLRATGTSQRTLVQVSGSGSRSTAPGTLHNVTDKVVPVGARSFRVDSTAGLAVGDTVIVRRPSTANWIHDISMDQLAMPWQPGSKDLASDRVITRIEGNQVTVDAPLTNALEARYGGGTISKYTFAGRIRDVGVEHIRGISDYVGSTDEEHSWRFVGFGATEDGWARRVTAVHFAYAAVAMNSTSKHVTVADSQYLDPISTITGGRRYSFDNDGQLNLVRDSYARGGRHDFVLNGANTPGPNVFVDDRSVNAYDDSGPHQRWITGGLFDNVNVQATSPSPSSNRGRIDVQNRGNSGTGHGWAGANMVIYNSIANGGTILDNPPTAQNWLIGSSGPLLDGTWYVGPRPERGVVESLGTPVQPRSLYYAQLQDRLATPGGSDREYWAGDPDGFARDGASDDPYVDPAWRAAVDASTTQPLVGFDVATNKTRVPFSVRFRLDPGEVVVGASLSLGLRATGTRTDTDTIALDGLGNSRSLAGLGWLPLSRTATNARVLDLSGDLGLLQDGLLNVALQDDTAVDWAVLNLRVAPTAQGGTIIVTPSADAYVQDGASAGTNFGTGTGLVTKTSGPGFNRDSYLRFDLSDVEGTVVRASVRLVATGVSDPVENAVAFVEDDGWGEATITWNNKPATGGAFASWSPSAGGTTEFLVTPFVQDAMAGDRRLSLRVLSTTKTSNGYVTYGSREASASFRPQLVLVVAATRPGARPLPVAAPPYQSRAAEAPRAIVDATPRALDASRPAVATRPRSSTSPLPSRVSRSLVASPILLPPDDDPSNVDRPARRGRRRPAQSTGP